MKLAKERAEELVKNPIGFYLASRMSDGERDSVEVIITSEISKAILEAERAADERAARRTWERAIKISRNPIGIYKGGIFSGASPKEVGEQIATALKSEMEKEK